MSDEVESMAYNKAEKPWHIGHTRHISFAVEHDLTPEQMLQAAKLDWAVENRPAYTTVNGVMIKTKNQSTLVRVRKNGHEDQIGPATQDWNPIQNIDAANFFRDWVAAGELNMETAGSLRFGEYVWFLAKLNESFELFRGRDKIDGYFLFTNPHKYGLSATVSLTAIRVVCWNTYSAALSSNKKEKDHVVRINHATEFDPDEVKATIGVSKERLAKYKEAAQFLSNKRAKDEDVVEYFNRLYPSLVPVTETGETRESRAVAKLRDILVQQPGHELGAGTWWQPFNAVTYYQDHAASVHGKTEDAKQESRLANSWYGQGRVKKEKALDLALEYAEKS